MNPLSIIHVDNHQLVANKPGGLVTQPSGTDQISLESIAKEWIKEQYNKPGNVFLEAIHRLDKPASGIVIFARTSKALSRLQESMRQKQTEKTYLAIIEGTMPAQKGLLKHFLMHGDHQAIVVSEGHPQGKQAILHYEVLKSHPDRSLLQIVLETGRYHQIRAQLATLGHPIVGDERYGSRVPFHAGAIALHHCRLQIPHPITGEMQLFEAPLPSYWPKDKWT